MLIEKAGSRRALAQLAGVKEGTVRAWLRGSKPFDSTVVKVCSALNVSPDWFLHGTGTAPAQVGEDPNESLRLRETPGDARRHVNINHPLSDSSTHMLKILETVSGEMTPTQLARVIPRLIDDLNIPTAKREEASAYLSELLSLRLKKKPRHN